MFCRRAHVVGHYLGVLMKTSQAGIDLITAHEGCVLHAYPDPATGGWPYTIGFGSTRNVQPGMVITHDQAVERLKEDLEDSERTITRLVTAQLDQHQFDALVSFVFNVGAGNFTKSTLLKKLNAHDFAGASQEFLKFTRAAGKVMKGLTIRREAERRLFLS